MNGQNQSKAYVQAMQALQRKCQLLEDQNRLLIMQNDELQLQVQQLANELQEKEELFEQLEDRLKEQIALLEEEFQNKEIQVEQLKQELHESLLDQSKIMEQHLMDKQNIQEQDNQIQKLKQVINRLKEPRLDTQSDKKVPPLTFQAKLEDTVEHFFSSVKKQRSPANDDYQTLIRRIQKIEDEIYQLESDQTNQKIIEEKLKILQQLQLQEESMLQQM
ncbi:hypothetical protein pb186bvf_020908 [Paramecium bursaria]